MKRWLALSTAAVALIAFTVAAEAQARRKPATRNASSVTITNLRQTPLQELDIATQANPPVIVAKLTKPLEPGKSAKLAIKGKRGCLFDVRGAYADDATVENDGVDLCKDSKLRLNE